MCAINGFSFRDEILIKKMISKTYQRGPDDKGCYIDDHASIGHNRLSIIDPDRRSKQPYYFNNLVLSFNGEIYNFKILKQELQDKGYKFETTSDTEVLIKLFYEFGVEAFKKISGIFAIAIWDKLDKKFFLIRDIVGVKPLYYSYYNSNIYFSSLIDPLKIVIPKNLNLTAMNYYGNFGYNDKHETFFSKIYKVLPGELITYKNKELKKEKFLKYNFKNANNNCDSKFTIKNIINKQSLSDVPIALALSGGIDSNIILSSLNIKKLKTYNLSFSYNNNDSLDSIYAKKRAKEFGTNHQEIKLTSDDFFNSLEITNSILEEPIGDPNSINNYILSKHIEEKVIISGDGGDEIFTGYDKYKSIYFIIQLSKLNLLKSLNIKTGVKNIDRFFYDNSKKMFLSFSKQNIFKENNLLKNYKTLNENDIFFNHYNKKHSKLNLANIMFADLDTWIPNDVLIRNDKIYMNEGIEVRVPYLDQEMIEKFLFYNVSKKINFFNKTKPFLRKIFKNELLSTLKKKKGFDSPFKFWLLEEKNFNLLKFFFSKDYYHSQFINYENVDNFLKRNINNHYKIFSNLMLLIFLKKNNF